MVQLSYLYMTTGKTTALTTQTFVSKVMFMLLNVLSRLVIAFLLRSRCLLISSSAVILEPKKIKSKTVSPCICHEMMGLDAIILVFWILSFKPVFPLSSSPSPRGSLVPLRFLPFRYPIKADDRMFPPLQKVLLGSAGVGPSLQWARKLGWLPTNSPSLLAKGHLWTLYYLAFWCASTRDHFQAERCPEPPKCADVTDR